MFISFRFLALDSSRLMVLMELKSLMKLLSQSHEPKHLQKISKEKKKAIQWNC